MPYSLIDAGVNLTNHQFDEQHQDIIARANAAGVKHADYRLRCSSQ